MKRYIEQLIEDLRDAALQAPGDPFDDENLGDEEALDMELEEIERFTSGPLEYLSDILGIPKSHLPKPARLNEVEMEDLVPEMLNLLEAYNFFPEYPKGVPSGLLYKALYSIWEDEFVPMSFGSIHIELCDGDEDDCPFPGYCDVCSEDARQAELIPENEFHVKANPLKGDLSKIDDDFNQIEKEYYKNAMSSDEEGFIPGIHNYCDRWCERCDFTDKCRVFAMEAEMRQMIEEGNDGKTEDFENISEITQNDEDDYPDIETELFDLMDDEFDGDPDDYFSAEQKATRHPLAELSTNYSQASFKWLLNRDEELKSKFTAQVAGGFADDVLEAEEVMGWYHLFISAKLRRALSGYFELDEFEEADYDMNGSAKAALVGIDRSIEAANILIRHVKNHREILKAFRTQLEDMRTMAEEQFPDARDFIRPGLDEL